MRGTLDDVRTEIDRICSGPGAGGGLILGPTNHFQIDVPPANIVEAYRYATDHRERVLRAQFAAPSTVATEREQRYKAQP